MHKAVLDSVVLISAFITEHKQGVSAVLLGAAERGAFQLYLSEDILAETKRVLLEDRRHLKRRYGYSDEAAERWCRALGALAHIVVDPPAVKVVERDPNDDMVVACAVEAKADFIVSRDKDLLALDHHGQLRIVTPEAFMQIIRSGERSQSG
jgi:putative PIN family toxin of toxin-antitoxin system